MNREFPTHQRPNESRLEAYRSEIAAMRQSNWPYRRIAGWLRAEKGLKISHEAVRKFCQVRKIGVGGAAQPSKRSPAVIPQPQAQTDKDSAPPARRVFSFDDSQPIRTVNNR